MAELIIGTLMVVYGGTVALAFHLTRVDADHCNHFEVPECPLCEIEGIGAHA